MSRRSLLILLVALVVIAIGAVWIAGWIGERTANEVSTAEAPDRSNESPESDPTIAPRLASLPSEASEQPSSVERPDPAPTRELAPSNPVDAELAAGIWVQGRVVIPPGTPADEHIEIVAESAEFERRGFHRVSPDPDGSFRVAFARGSTLGTLLLEAQYLYMESLPTLSLPTNRELVLRPALGGCIRGHILLPAAGRAERTAIVGSSVKASASTSSPAKELNQSSQVRRAPIDDDLGFMLTGIPARKDCHLSLDSTVVSTSQPVVARVEPGRVTVIDLLVEDWATISGVAVDPEGRPADGSTVHAMGSPRRSDLDVFRGSHSDKDWGRTIVEEEGRFELRLPEGSFSVWVEGKDRVRSVPMDIEVGWGQSIQDLTLRLSRGGRLLGRVLDSEDRPRAGVRIEVRREKESMPRGLRHSWSTETNTDERGDFAIQYLVPGEHEVIAYQVTEEPKSLRTAFDSADVLIEEGRTTEIVLGGRTTDSVVVTGTVSAGGKPCASWTVTAFPRNADIGDVQKATTDAMGRYRLVLNHPGSVSFQLTSESRAASVREVVEVSATPTFEKDFVVGGNGRLTGRVVDDEGHGVPDIAVSVDSLRSRKGSAGASFHEATSTDSKGEFRVEGVPGGTFRIDAGRKDAAGMGGRLEDVVLAEGASIDGLVLRVQKYATVLVTVSRADGKSVTLAFVRASSGKDLNTWSSGTQAGTNRYELRGIIPGSVIVEATSFDDPPLAGSVALVLAPGARESVEVVLHPATMLRLKLAAPGRDLAEVEVVVRGEPGASTGPTRILAVDQIVEYQIGPLGPGRYEVLATHPDGSSARAEVVVVSGTAEQTVSLTLER